VRAIATSAGPPAAVVRPAGAPWRFRLPRVCLRDEASGAAWTTVVGVRVAE
jgi:hypothetical protein